MTFVWLLGGLAVLAFASWIGARVLRALFGPGREPRKTGGHALSEAEQLTRNPKV